MFNQHAAQQDFEDAENAHYDRILILNAEHWDGEPGEENPYAATLAAREVVADWGGEDDTTNYTVEINDEGVEYLARRDV